MNCKFCQQELEEGVTLCPACGKDNADVDETVVEESAPVEETAAAQKPGIGKMMLALGIMVALVVLLAAMVMGGNQTPGGETDITVADPTELTEPTQATQPATTPADTGLNDATCKGTYSVSDEELVAARDNVVATLGEEVMTVADLQVYYWRTVSEFMASEDFYYLCYYYGVIDPTQPLDTQICYYDQTLTWQQYFVDLSISTWHEFTSIVIAARENNLQMNETRQADLDGMEEGLTTLATENGFASPEALLEYNMGAGVTLEAYANYWETYYLYCTYVEYQYEALLPTAEEVETYYQEKLEYFEEHGVTKEIKTVDVRHVLITPNENASTYTEEEWAAAEKKAQDLLDAWLAGEATEESFAKMANANSTDPGSNAKGGLYTGVAVGTMVPEFNDWCFDESRQVGDYGLVKTSYGWHIMYFSGSETHENTEWFATVESDMLYYRMEEVMDDVLNQFELVTDYSKMILGKIKLPI